MPQDGIHLHAAMELSNSDILISEIFNVVLNMYGRGERIWTSDILLPKQARYQAALRPEMVFAHFHFTNKIYHAFASVNRQWRHQNFCPMGPIDDDGFIIVK